MATLPTELGYGTLTGGIIGAIADTAADPDHDPDAWPIPDLQVSITASAPTVTVSAVKRIVVIEPHSCAFDNDGVMRLVQWINPDGTAKPGAPAGVRLIASDDPDMVPTGWTYTVTVRSAFMATISKPFTISEGQTLDLTDLPITSPSPGVWITKGDPGESAYNLAVADGFVGTEAEWLASLHGTDGAPGAASMARTTATNLDTLTGAANAGAWSFGPTAIGHPTGVGNGVAVVAAAGTHTSETATLQSGEVLVRYYAGASWSTWRRLAAVQDTGWRDVTSLFDPAAIAPDNTGTVHFRRIGNVITCKFVSLKLADGTGDMNLWDNSIPTGWRPSLRVNSFISRSNSIPSWNAISAWTASITWYSQWTISTGASTRTRSGIALIGEMSWQSSDVFPTTLIGTPL